MPIYLRELSDAQIKPTARPIVVEEHDNRATVSGQLGFGQITADFAMRLAIRKARQNAIASVSIVHVNHIGRLGHYLEMAVAEGLICQIWASGFAVLGARAAPFGGRDRVLDTNPLAIGIPAGNRPPVIVDFATTGGSGVKVINAARRGEALPLGAIVDQEGRPTTNPADFENGGAYAPFGAHKGYALMLCSELLGRVLSGSDGYVRDGEGPPLFRHQGVTMLCMRANLHCSMEDFTARVDAMLDKITQSRPAAGFDKVLYPGLKEHETRERSMKEGIRFEDDIWELFSKGAKNLGVNV
jgi:LDH2 family malate/lactate/ureidoglycolate dehydrogenase